MSVVEQITDESIPPASRMTEEEFVQWASVNDVRAEWVDGEVIVMAPDNYEHAFLSSWLMRLLGSIAEIKDLGVIVGPNFMIRLPTQRRRRVPDLLFIANDRRHLIRKAHLEGAPDMAFEIVSPDSQSRDWRDKYLEYEKAGVREYWIVDPASQHVEAYGLTAAGSFSRIAETDGKLVSTVLPGLYVMPDWLWQQPLPRVADVLLRLGITL